MSRPEDLQSRTNRTNTNSVRRAVPFHSSMGLISSTPNATPELSDYVTMPAKLSRLPLEPDEVVNERTIEQSLHSDR